MPEGAVRNLVELARQEAPDAAAPIQLLREDGTLRPEAQAPLSIEETRRVYRFLVLLRQLDQRMMNLQRQGRIGFYMTATGEEAAILGSGLALEPSDWIFPCYREHALLLWRGMSLEIFISQLMGNSGDPTKGRQMPIHLASRELRYASVSSPIATQIPQAVGAAWAARIKGEPTVAIAYFGDGATSHGDFHVGANFAGVFRAPVILFCRNNGWAISTPSSVQTAAETFAQKAVAYGIEGVRVDGNDLFAVVEVTRRAAERARAGGGATLIEAVTYRRGAHSSSDDPSVYRDDAEARAWDARDPLARLRRYLERQGQWSEAEQKRAEEEANAEVGRALQAAEAHPPPPPSSLFDDVFAEVPRHLVEQRAELLSYLESKGR
jgi:2-oxoisovalerate dehydrogenase E1 component alpha subunit